MIETDADGATVSAEDRTKAREFLKKEIQALKENITHEFHETVRRQVARLPDSIKGDTRRRLDNPPGYLLPNLSLMASRIPSADTQRTPKP